MTKLLLLISFTSTLSTVLLAMNPAKPNQKTELQSEIDDLDAWGWYYEQNPSEVRDEDAISEHFRITPRETDRQSKQSALKRLRNPGKKSEDTQVDAHTNLGGESLQKTIRKASQKKRRLASCENWVDTADKDDEYRHTHYKKLLLRRWLNEQKVKQLASQE